MLVLTRKPGESLIMSGGIEVTVTKVVGKRVSIGITAPDEVRVDRPDAKKGERDDAED